MQPYIFYQQFGYRQNLTTDVVRILRCLCFSCYPLGRHIFSIYLINLWFLSSTILTNNIIIFYMFSLLGIFFSIIPRVHFQAVNLASLIKCIMKYQKLLFQVKTKHKVLFVSKQKFDIFFQKNGFCHTLTTDLRGYFLD